jgi:hypothetical protein
VVLYIRGTISFSETKYLVPEPLEIICIEVRRPHKVAFLISAWYRPPNSNNDAFNGFNLFLCKCDLETQELMIVGDINCDFAKAVPDSHTQRLQLSCFLYQLDQLIIVLPVNNMYKIERNRVNVATRSAKKCTFVTKSRNAHKVGMLKIAGI